MPSIRRHRAISGGHLVVCGDTVLAFRLAIELSAQYDQDVNVIFSPKAPGRVPKAPPSSRVRVLEATALNEEVLQAARAGSARAVAFVGADENDNIDAALRVQELNPGARLVIRMSDMTLGPWIVSLFDNCAALSDAAMAAPFLVAAALGHEQPRRIVVAGRALHVVERKDRPEQVLCGLADTSDPDGGPRLLPADQDRADLLLATAPAIAGRTFRHRLHRLWNRTVTHRDALALVFRGPLPKVLSALMVAVAVGSIALGVAAGYRFPQAVYLVLLDIAGAATPDLTLNSAAKVAQTAVTLASLGLVPAVTAAFVDARFRARVDPVRRLTYPISGHVVVVGLGELGLRVASQLADLGVLVVGVDTGEGAASRDLARRARIPIVFGDGTRRETLKDAWVQTSRAVIAATGHDISNVKVGVQARAIRADVRVVLRLTDDDFASRVYRRLDADRVVGTMSSITVSAFARAMLDRQVLATIPVGRKVMLIADVPVEPGSALDGRPVSEAGEPERYRVLAVRPRGRMDHEWNPEDGYVLTPGDSLVVVATRDGLRRLLARSGAPTSPDGRDRAVSSGKPGRLGAILRRGLPRRRGR
ncbi:NAD-binding protein [Actinoallomurus sp. CA-142502]|uniref:NAD-binding protein n=1 Tax=Actinoallomurus sp. CA-142502 TaxID=3239885 RepID=UPI003D8B015E